MQLKFVEEQVIKMWGEVKRFYNNFELEERLANNEIVVESYDFEFEEFVPNVQEELLKHINLDQDEVIPTHLMAINKYTVKDFNYDWDITIEAFIIKEDHLILFIVDENEDGKIVTVRHIVKED